jgi:hypothetical protein
VDKVFLPWAGSYNDGVAACTTCPIGYTSTAASTAASDCTFSACPAGFTGDEGHGCNATVRALSLGDYFTCAQNATLALKCWGYGGSLGDGTTVSRLTPVIAPLVALRVRHDSHSARRMHASGTSALRSRVLLM